MTETAIETAGRMALQRALLQRASAAHSIASMDSASERCVYNSSILQHVVVVAHTEVMVHPKHTHNRAAACSVCRAFVEPDHPTQRLCACTQKSGINKAKSYLCHGKGPVRVTRLGFASRPQCNHQTIVNLSTTVKDWLTELMRLICLCYNSYNWPCSEHTQA